MVITLEVDPAAHRVFSQQLLRGQVEDTEVSCGCLQSEGGWRVFSEQAAVSSGVVDRKSAGDLHRLSVLDLIAAQDDLGLICRERTHQDRSTSLLIKQKDYSVLLRLHPDPKY